MLKKVCPVCLGKLIAQKDALYPWFCEKCKKGVLYPFIYLEPSKQDIKILKEIKKTLTTIKKEIKDGFKNLAKISRNK